jgi:hypothetical protein
MPNALQARKTKAITALTMPNQYAHLTMYFSIVFSKVSQFELGSHRERFVGPKVRLQDLSSQRIVLFGGEANLSQISLHRPANAQSLPSDYRWHRSQRPKSRL